MAESPAQSDHIFEEVVYRIIALLEQHPGRGVSLAITSANSGEGVTFTTNLLLQALQRLSPRRIQRISLDAITSAQRAGADERTYAESAAIASADVPSSTRPVGSVTIFRRETLRQHLAETDILLIDCPPLKRSMQTFSILPFVDGVVVVVQAGRTTKSDVNFVKRQVLAGAGNLEGFVLNKWRKR